MPIPVRKFSEFAILSPVPERDNRRRISDAKADAMFAVHQKRSRASAMKKFGSSPSLAESIVGDKALGRKPTLTKREIFGYLNRRISECEDSKEIAKTFKDDGTAERAEMRKSAFEEVKKWLENDVREVRPEK